MNTFQYYLYTHSESIRIAVMVYQYGSRGRKTKFYYGLFTLIGKFPFRYKRHVIGK